MLHKAPGGTRPTHNNVKGGSLQGGNSKPNNFAVGSGSRPTTSKVPVNTSSPHHPHKLDSRHVPGALGQGKTKK